MDLWTVTTNDFKFTLVELEDYKCTQVRSIYIAVRQVDEAYRVLYLYMVILF